MSWSEPYSSVWYKQSLSRSRFNHLQTYTDRYRQIHALPIHAHINTFPIHAHINTLYMPVYVCIIAFPHDFRQRVRTPVDVCILAVYACICMYDWIYKHIQANTDCYIPSYALLYLYIFCICMFIFVHICLIFAVKSLSRTIWARMSTDIHIWTTICTYMHEYIHYTCKIHAKYMHVFRARCTLYVKADVI